MKKPSWNTGLVCPPVTLCCFKKRALKVQHYNQLITLKTCWSRLPAPSKAPQTSHHSGTEVTRRGAESEMKQGASPCHSKTRGTARTKHSGAWTKQLEPEPAGQERNLHWDSSYRGQVAKIRARNFGASWAPPDSSLFLTAPDTSAGCSTAPLCVSLPTGIGGVSAWASPPSLVNALRIYRWSWQSEQRWHRQSGRADRWLWEISSAPRHWKNHLKKQFIAMKLLLLEWKY